MATHKSQGRKFVSSASFLFLSSSCLRPLPYIPRKYSCCFLLVSSIFSISIFGTELALRWYALAYIVGIIIGWRLVVMTVKTPRLWPGQQPVVPPEQIEAMLTRIILGVLLGRRLG